MLGFELLDFQADDFRQTGGDLLGHVAVFRRKLQADEGDLQRPVSTLGSAAENHPAKGHQQQDQRN